MNEYIFVYYQYIMYLDYETINISFKANVFLNFDLISLEIFNLFYECKLISLKFSFFYLLKNDIYLPFIKGYERI